MEVINNTRHESKKELSKARTDDLLMVYEEIQWSLPKTADAGPKLGIDKRNVSGPFWESVEGGSGWGQFEHE